MTEPWYGKFHNMKILILDTYYDGFLSNYYKNYSCSDLSYEANRQKIMNRLFGTSDFYSKNLRLLGHNAEELILNDKILQKKWAKEHGQLRLFDWADGLHFPFTKIGFHSNWQKKILEQQIIDFKPNIIYCQSLYNPGFVFLNKIRQKIKVTIIGQIASAINFNKSFLSVYDLILTSFPHFVKHFRDIGIKSEYFRIGFEETVLSKLKKTEKQYDVTFVGSFSRHHNNETVVNAATDIWGHGIVPQTKEYHDEVWGIDMYNILYNSKITLNRHIDTAEDHANNMRLYEATGVGTMLITDYKKDLDKLFVPGKEVETYKSKEELAEKIKYYLSHDREREKIAEAGQKRTLRDHTYKKRMKELVQILNKYL